MHGSLELISLAQDVQKIWRGIKFGGLVFLFRRQTAKFNSTKMLSIHWHLWNIVNKLPNL